MKAYLIFIDGGNIPQSLHANEFAAIEEAKRLAKKFPEKEIMLLQVVKRFKSNNGELVSLGSHLPPLTTNDLVRKMDIAKIAEQKRTSPKVEYKNSTLRLPKKEA
jgi:hypothetical protein